MEIADEVLKALPEIQKNLPSDVKLNVIMDTSENIKLTISGLTETVVYAFLFVILVVLAFLSFAGVQRLLLLLQFLFRSLLPLYTWAERAEV